MKRVLIPSENLKNTRIILSHPTGNANVRATLNAFLEADLLEMFYTSIACFSGNGFDKLSAIKGLGEFNRRRFDDTLKNYTRSIPLRELGRLFASRFKINNLLTHEKGYFSIDAVYRAIDRNVAEKLAKFKEKNTGGIYAYEDGAANSFHEAKQLGLQCFYDLPTGYWRAKFRILEEEKKRTPEWQSTITGFFDSKGKLDRKDDEIKMADRIFVASKFTASTLKDFPGPLPSVTIVPYGFPDVGEARVYNAGKNGIPVRLLFVGNLSQQKGIANLFKAVDRLGDQVSLTLVGRKASNDCAVLDTELTKHRWIPSLPHNEILKIMREHDVLVFPTLFDGFGLVISEAMSQGTPVIATYNCAGPDLIEHGRNGWLAKAGSTDSLYSIIEELVQNPSSIGKAGIEAMETARNRPWAMYRSELSSAIKRHYDSLL